jgi:hypothetical protein
MSTVLTVSARIGTLHQLAGADMSDTKTTSARLNLEDHEVARRVVLHRDTWQALDAYACSIGASPGDVARAAIEFALRRPRDPALAVLARQGL